jgi:lysophospholipase L1-like esterase
VRIAPHADVASDPVRLRVRPFEPLVVSVYAPGQVANPTEHLVAQQTSYLTPPGSGDHAADSGADAFIDSTNSWLLVDGVDVRTRRPAGAVVAFGDSLTDGEASTPNADDRYPDYLQRQLLARNGPRKAPSVLNAGLSGSIVSRHLPNNHGPGDEPSGLQRARRDVIEQPGATAAIVELGLNDLGLRAGARHVIRALGSLVGRLRRAGLRVLLGTITPAKQTGVVERRLKVVNRWIRDQARATPVDFNAALRNPADPARLAPRYDSGDHVHPNDAGYRAMARAVPLARLGGRGCR